jgi:hypothetical protein
MALDPQPCTIQQPGHTRSGPPPDYYTIGLTLCLILCGSVSFTITRYGQGFASAGGGFGVGGGVTVAPGFIDNRNPKYHTPSYVNSFIAQNSATASAGAGPVGAAEQWGNVGHRGWSNFSSETGVQQVGASAAVTWTYSWNMGHWEGAMARPTPFECAHLGLCN